MKNVTVRFPHYTVGENVLENIGSVVKSYGSKTLIIGGKTALEKASSKITASLAATGIDVVEVAWYGGECTFKNIEELCSKALQQKAESIIGVGGGKAIDTAKAVSERTKLPIITVPTIAATCAATTALSIVYSEKGDFDSLYQLTRPPVHILIDSDVIAKAPTKYLWAGIGDTLAKYYEVHVTTKGKRLAHSAAMAKSLSIMCAEPLIQYGGEAMDDSEKSESSFALEQIILNNIISTGIVAMLVGDENNGAAAHGLFYGLTLLEEIERFHLHGEVVAYGVLVLLTMNNQLEELDKLYPFYKAVKLPTCLEDIDVKNDREYLEPVLEKAVNAPDMLKMPYKVSKDMLFDAIQKLEKYNHERL
ncbi:MAG: iron-containing alcohol dehydrogenase family protein [Bacillota bacterium]